MSKYEVLTDEERATEEMGKLGMVFSDYANSKALSLLRQMADSVCIIDDMACWDHGAMFDLRDEIERLLDIEAYRAKLTAGVELPKTVTVSQVKNSSYAEGWNDCYDEFMKAIAADRARLAGQEAVAKVEYDEDRKEWKWEWLKFPLTQKLYSAPVPAQAEKVEPVACSLGCVASCKAREHGNASECPALPNQPPFTPPIAPQSLLDAVNAGELKFLREALIDLEAGRYDEVESRIRSIINRYALQEHGRAK